MFPSTVSNHGLIITLFPFCVKCFCRNIWDFSQDCVFLEKCLFKPSNYCTFSSYLKGFLSLDLRALINHQTFLMPKVPLIQTQFGHVSLNLSRPSQAFLICFLPRLILSVHYLMNVHVFSNFSLFIFHAYI